MPDLNRHGVTIHGRGVRFLTDGTLIAQQDMGGDRWQVCTRPVEGGDWVPIHPWGASRLAARAGYWLAHLPGRGVFGAAGVVGEAMGLVGDGVAADDGTIGLVLDYQTGIGLRLQRPDGSHLDVPEAMPLELAIADRDRALWFDGRTRQIETLNLPRPRVVLAGPLFAPWVGVLAGEWWIAYHSTDEQGVVLHPFGSLAGYRITLPPAFYLRAVALNASRVKFAWGWNQGDTDGTARVVDVAADPRVDLRPVLVPPPAPQPLPEPEPMMTMQLPPAVYATFVACVQKFPHSGSDDDRRAAMKKAVQTIRARHGLKWATKSEHATGWAAASTDALCYVPGGAREGEYADVYIWDMINGSTREPTSAVESEPLRKAYVLAPMPWDWLAMPAPQPEPQPEPEPDPQPDPGGPEDEPLDVLRAILVEVRALRRHLGVKVADRL